MATALLVVDMQSFFVAMTGVSLPNMLRLIEHFSARSLPTIFTQHGHTKEELTPPYKNQLVRKWGPDGSIHVGSPDWEFIPEIKKRVTDQTPVIPKNTYDAFLGSRLEGKPLEDVLKEKNVERLVVCGVMTDCCVDTTARSAFNRGFETWLVDDASGSANKKQHEAGLRGFGFAFGEVMSTKDVLKALE